MWRYIGSETPISDYYKLFSLSMQVHGMISSVLGQTMETHGVEVYRPAVSIMGQRGYGPPPWILINTVGYRKSPK